VVGGSCSTRGGTREVSAVLSSDSLEELGERQEVNVGRDGNVMNNDGRAF
jgi:hypothetical protein